MTDPSSYTHVLYHSNCYDGFGSALAAWQHLGDGAEYIPVTHGDPPPDLPADARVLIADFSYPRAAMLTLNENVEHLHVLDHHKTAETELEGLDFCEFDMHRSGAVMTWQHFNVGEVPLFFRYLEDRDLWRFDLPDSKAISQALRAYPFDFHTWDMMDCREGVERLRMEGPVVLRHTEQMVDIMCRQAVIVSVGGYGVPVVNATVFFSEVGDRLCELYKAAPFAGYYLDRADGKRQWGLRSRDGFDVSEIAKQYGGGGHAAAAGFVTHVGRTL